VVLDLLHEDLVRTTMDHCKLLHFLNRDLLRVALDLLQDLVSLLAQPLCPCLRLHAKVTSSSKTNPLGKGVCLACVCLATCCLCKRACP